MTDRTLQPRETIGGFEIVRILGRGGQGVVYLARRQADGLQTALKVAASAQPDYRHRLIREFRALGRLSHPHLVRVYEHGEDGGRLYFAMEYVSGRDIRALVRERGNAPPDEAWIERTASIAVQVTSALGYIHGQGLVHRDVKPSNVRLQPGGLAKLLDFGLVTPGDGDVELTEAGFFLGSAPYIPPEQIMGQPVDARTDLYALGATLFHLLAGRPPFLAATVTRTVVEVLQQPAPGLRDLAPAVPVWLAEIVDRLLAKLPRERFQHAGELLAALQQAPATAGGLPPALRLRSSVVGRDAELAEIQAAFEALRRGDGGVLVLAGEPGIGKSRLLAEIQDMARLQPFGLLTSHIHQGDSTPFSGLKGWFERLAGRACSFPEDGPPAERAALAAVAPELACLRGPGPAGEPDPELRRRLPELAAGALLRLVPGPAVLTLDDAGGADPATAEALVQLAKRLLAGPPVPLLLALAGPRPAATLDGAAAPMAELAALVRASPHGRWLELAPLKPGDLAGLLAEALGRTDLPAGSARELHRRSGGNPLFAVELIRFMNQSSGEPPGIEATVSASSTTITDLPRVLLDLGRRRAGEVGPAARRLAEMMAVAGISAPHDLLQRLWSGPEEEMMDGLSELLATGLASEHFERGQLAYAFTHDVVRESIVADTADLRRTELHLALGQAMAGLGGPDARFSAAVMAAHFAAGGEPLEAVRLEIEAAGQSLALGRGREALAVIQTATTHLAGTAAVERARWRSRLLTAAAQAEESLGEAETALEHLEEALALARGCELTAEHAAAARRLAAFHLQRGRSGEGRELAQQAFELYRRLDDAEGMMAAVNSVAISHSLEGDLEGALAQMEDGLRLAHRHGRPQLLAAAMNNYGVALLQAGRRGEARRFVLEGLALREQLLRPQLAGSNPAWWALAPDPVPDGPAADEHYRKARQVFTASRDELGAAEVGIQRARLLFGMLRWGEALAELRVGFERLRRLKAPLRSGWAALQLARGLGLVGRWDEATRVVGEALDELAGEGLAEYRAQALAQRVALELRAGRLASARDSLRWLRELARSPAAAASVRALEIWLQTFQEPAAEAARILVEHGPELESPALLPAVRELAWLAGLHELAAGRPAEALAKVEAELADSPDPVPILFGIQAVRVQALAALARPAEARALAGEAAAVLVRLAAGLAAGDRAAFSELPEVRALTAVPPGSEA